MKHAVQRCSLIKIWKASKNEIHMQVETIKVMITVRVSQNLFMYHVHYLTQFVTSIWIYFKVAKKIWYDRVLQKYVFFFKQHLIPVASIVYEKILLFIIDLLTHIWRTQKCIMGVTHFPYNRNTYNSRVIHQVVLCSISIRSFIH